MDDIVPYLYDRRYSYSTLPLPWLKRKSHNSHIQNVNIICCKHVCRLNEQRIIYKRRKCTVFVYKCVYRFPCPFDVYKLFTWTEKMWNPLFLILHTFAWRSSFVGCPNSFSLHLHVPPRRHRFKSENGGKRGNEPPTPTI